MERDLDERILAVLERIETRLGQSPADADRDRPKQERRQAGSARGMAGGNEEEAWLETSEEQVATLLAPFANSQRIKLLKALYLGVNESGQLKEFTGLTGGQLYHHLKELALAKFLSRETRGEYRLSTFGYYAFSALMILTADLLAEAVDEELVAPDEIGALE